MKKCVMIDLETMSVTKKAAILSIGAVEFDPSVFTTDDAPVLGTFYANVSLESCVEIGLMQDASTREWWSRPEQGLALAALQAGQVSIRQALIEFRQWCLADTNPEDIEPWANGTSFDLAILETAYLFSGLPHPWKFYNERDYRTMKMLYAGVGKPEFEGQKHNALADANFQAMHLIKIMRHINGVVARSKNTPVQRCANCCSEFKRRYDGACPECGAISSLQDMTPALEVGDNAV